MLVKISVTMVREHTFFPRFRCPTSEALAVTYYSSSSHNWGFKFKTPKFEGFNELYLTCDVFVCDMMQDPKPYCDRSCLSPVNDQNRRRRRRSTATHDGTSGKVMRGPFVVLDSSSGPLLTWSGDLRVHSKYWYMYAVVC